MKKEKNKKVKKNLGTIISLVAGVVLGVLSIWTIGFDFADKTGVVEFMLGYMGTFLMFFVVLYIDIILHEAGHLVMGLMSGYQFGFFRIGSWMLAKYEDGIKFKKFTLPGTGGQCLMVPPAYNDGNFPYKRYYAGGVLVNAITAIIMLTIGLVLGTENYWGKFMIVSAMITGYLVVENTIPKDSNDGALLFQAETDEEQRKSIWECLQYVALQQQGARAKDMPRIWEPMTDEELVAGVDKAGTISKLGARLSYLLDLQDYETVYTLLDKSLSNKKMMSILKQQFKIEKLFTEILLYNRSEEIEKLYDDELKTYIKQTTKTMIGTARFMYAYYLLVEKNEEKAQREKERFERLCKNHPYAGDMAVEKEMMCAIDAKAQELKANEITA
ncbi:MAG: M50 family metallopeptidase [Lachnospiraceae bacterium]|nr:M50 family metallopeptidase [Lachnospiraceae bacterium]